jgi:hypothetical protein
MPTERVERLPQTVCAKTSCPWPVVPKRCAADGGFAVAQHGPHPGRQRHAAARRLRQWDRLTDVGHLDRGGARPILRIDLEGPRV